MIGKFYLAKKGALYLCVAAPLGVVATDPGPKVSHAVAKAKHRINRVTHSKVFKEQREVGREIQIVTIPAECDPALGSGGGSSGGIWGGGGGYHGGFGGGPVPSGGGSSGGGTPPGTPIVASPTPEPETYAMVGLGLGMAGFIAHKRKRIRL